METISSNRLGMMEQKKGVDLPSPQRPAATKQQERSGKRKHERPHVHSAHLVFALSSLHRPCLVN